MACTEAATTVEAFVVGVELETVAEKLEAEVREVLDPQPTAMNMTMVASRNIARRDTTGERSQGRRGTPPTGRTNTGSWCYEGVGIVGMCRGRHTVDHLNL